MDSSSLEDAGGTGAIDNSIDGVVRRILAQETVKKESVSARIGDMLASSRVTRFDPTGTGSISSLGTPGSDIGAATSLAAAGMAKWLGDTSLAGRNKKAQRQIERRSTSYSPGENSRFLITPGAEDDEATVLILDPELPFEKSRRVTEEVQPEFEALRDIMGDLGDTVREMDGPERSEQADMLAKLPPDFAALLTQTVRPEIIATSLPAMKPLCVPRPCMPVLAEGHASTAGIFCTDEDGRLGITACYHGTGPVGTKVEIGLREYAVALADPVQDIVFIAFENDVNIPELVGTAGVVTGRAPGQQELADFEGATSGATRTIISSHDAGLLRRRAALQLKLQTRPDANHGDSGSALIDQSGQVMAFAFQRTEFGAYPEFTDWIWADNALSALGLTPLKIL